MVCALGPHLLLLFSLCPLELDIISTPSPTRFSRPTCSCSGFCCVGCFCRSRSLGQNRRAQPQAAGGVLPPGSQGWPTRLPHGTQLPCCGEAQANHVEMLQVEVLASSLVVAPANSQHRLPGLRVKTPPDDPNHGHWITPSCQAFQLRPRMSWAETSCSH